MKQDWLFAAIGLLVAVGAGETACKSAIIFGVLATIAIISRWHAKRES